MDGGIYRLPDSMVSREYYNSSDYAGAVTLKNLPLTDSPLLLTFGAFYPEG